ncbi:hypothetical protein J6Q66_02665 [bacterium]|nr:hypothetical protein [bacterium]
MFEVTLHTLAEWGATFIEKYSNFSSWFNASFLGTPLFSLFLGVGLSLYVNRVILKFLKPDIDF